MTYNTGKMLVLRACESANGTRAIPERAVQIKENRLWFLPARNAAHSQQSQSTIEALRRLCKRDQLRLS
jgi:hypothetical protein